MKHFLMGAAVAAIVLIVSLIIHIFCNTHGIEIDQVTSSVVSAVGAMLIYHGLIKNEKK